MDRALLMPGQYMPNPTAVEGIIERQNRPARMAKNRVDPFLEQAFHENVRALHGLVPFSALLLFVLLLSALLRCAVVKPVRTPACRRARKECMRRLHYISAGAMAYRTDVS